MGEIVQFRDYQSAAAIERAHKALEEHLNQQANEIMSIALSGIPCAGFVEVPKDYDPRKPA